VRSSPATASRRTSCPSGRTWCPPPPHFNPHLPFVHTLGCHHPPAQPTYTPAHSPTLHYVVQISTCSTHPPTHPMPTHAFTQVPDAEQGRRPHGPHGACARDGHVPRRYHRGVSCRRRDSSLLEVLRKRWLFQEEGEEGKWQQQQAHRIHSLNTRHFPSPGAPSSLPIYALFCTSRGRTHKLEHTVNSRRDDDTSCQEVAQTTKNPTVFINTFLHFHFCKTVHASLPRFCAPFFSLCCCSCIVLRYTLSEL
jgi:hypothetical protein